MFNKANKNTDFNNTLTHLSFPEISNWFHKDDMKIYLQWLSLDRVESALKQIHIQLAPGNLTEL